MDFCPLCLDLKPENILLKQQGRSGIKGRKTMIEYKFCSAWKICFRSDRFWFELF